jgi:hypothetical protein
MIEFLHGLKMFQGHTVSMLKKLISVLTKKKFHRGQIVYREG